MVFTESACAPVVAGPVTTLQINMGYLCNLSCRHCHVNAGPTRTETAGRRVLSGVLDALGKSDIPFVDITGGAPEMNADFRPFLASLYEMGRKVTVRTNLVILDDLGYEDIPELYARYGVELVASLPSIDSGKTDRQRGGRVFERSIKVLQKLNKLGFGQPDSPLKLNLVHNPTGAYMPGSQQAIEEDYHKRLKAEYNISFNTLYCITNMPVGRFEQYLIKSENYTDYIRSLKDSFNVNAVKSLMCINTVSVDWQGRLYDCDFNQCQGLPLSVKNADIWNFNPDMLIGREIVLGEHCYGCTAGAGSSCRGNIA